MVFRSDYELTMFKWPVIKDGYHWEKGIKKVSGPSLLSFKEENETWLVIGNGPAYYYLPLIKHSSLFRTFAETEPTRGGILAFAKDYGHLGVDRLVFPQKGSAGEQAEKLSEWHSEIWAMRNGLALWDAASARDEKTLRQHIHWEEGPAIRYSSRPNAFKQKDMPLPVEGESDESEIIAMRDGEQLEERLRYFTPGDTVGPALFRVQDVINKHMRDHVSPRLLWDKDLAHSELHIVPHNLLGALWLQFAEAVNGDKKYRRCEECGKWFELSPDLNRTNRKYCSGACRSKTYRRKKEEEEGDGADTRTR
jgi:hypothetical protein